MKKTQSLLFFLCGAVVGAVSYFGMNKTHKTSPSNADIAIGETLFEELQSYPKNWKIENITRVMEELASRKRLPQPTKERDNTLLELAAIESEQLATQNILKANEFMSSITSKEGIIPKVEGKVYFETLLAGQGEEIGPKDIISITFKQLSPTGEVLKNTHDKSFPVHLSRMIKGFTIGLQGAKIGEKRKIYIHPDYGFGRAGRSNEPNQVLIYEVHIHKLLKQN